MSEEPREKPGNFIRDIIAEHNAQRAIRRRRRHAVSAGAQRLPPHRSRQGDLDRLRHWPGSSAAAATSGSTTPTRPRKSQEYVDSIMRRPCAGSATTGASTSTTRSDYFEQLYAVGGAARSRRGKAYVDDLDAGADPEHRGTLDRARPREPVPRPLGRGEPRPVRAHARRASSTDGAQDAAREDRHGLAATSTCAIRSCTGSARRRTIARAMRGASIRCTTGRTASRTRSRASRIRSARSSTRTTGRSTTGISTSSASTTRSRSSSRA